MTFKNLLLMAASTFYLLIAGFQLTAGETFRCVMAAGAPGWVIQKGRITTDPLGGHYLHLAAAPGDKGIASLRLKKALLVAGADLVVGFRYRTDVDHSMPHIGTWIYLQFFGGDGKMIKTDVPGWPLKQAASWREFSGRIKVPPGCVSANLQIRLQNKPGRFLDLADVGVGFAAAVVKELDDPQRKLRVVPVVTFSLQPDMSLRSTDGQVLRNLSPPNLTPCYELPGKYCNRSVFYYGLKIHFKRTSGTPYKATFHTIFSLGSVFSGKDGNSMEIAFLNHDTRLMFRTRCVNNRGTMQWHYQINNGNVDFKVAALLGRREMYTTIGAGWKKVGSAQPFVWEQGRRFYLGGTGPQQNKLNGKILNFTLTVYRPVITAEFDNPINAGLFQGAGPHRWSIRFPEADAQKIKFDFTVKDWFGKTYSPVKVVKTTGRSVEFELPVLPYGWYKLSVKMSSWKQVRTISRAFTVSRIVNVTTPAAKSPMGITQGFSMEKGVFSPEVTERMFAASAAAGNRWFRLWTVWDAFEQKPGVRDWSVMDQIVKLAEKYRLQLYVCLEGGNLWWQTSHEPETPKLTTYLSQYRPRDLKQWAAFVTEFARRYRGRVEYFQVGNESNTKEFYQPFSAKSYLTFLKAGYTAVKQGNPDAKVGLCGFVAVSSTLNAPDMKPGERIFGMKEFWNLKPGAYFDIVDCHFYSLNAIDYIWDGHVKAVPKIHEFLKARGEDKKPLWNSETGFQSGIKGERGGYDANPMVSDYEHAYRIVEWHIQSQAVGIERSFNYLVTGTSGLLHGDYSPKPSLPASANVALMLSDMKFKRSLPLSGGLFGYEFVNTKTGEHMVTVWSRGGPLPVAIKSAPGAKVTRSDLFGNAVALSGKGGLISIVIDESPIYITSAKPFEMSSLITTTQKISRRLGMVAYEVKVINPSSVAMHGKVGLGFPGMKGESQEFMLAGGKEKQVLLNFPVGDGLPSVSARFAWGACRQMKFSAVIPCLKRRQVMIGKNGQAELRIDRPEQLRIGAAKFDDQNRPMIASQWHGVKDLSASVRLRRHNNRLSFEINVKDNQVVTDPIRQPYELDCVELFYALPGQNYLITEQGQIILRADGRIFPMRKAGLPGLVLKHKKIPGGYLFCGSFELSPQVLRAGYMLFDLALDDADAGDHARRSLLVWSGNEDNYRSTQGYGVIILDK